MQTTKKLLIIIGLLILILVVGILKFIQLQDRTVNEYLSIQEEVDILVAEKVLLNENVKKLEGLIGLYDNDIKSLHKSMEAPIYVPQETGDTELLQEVHTYIKENNLFNDSLIFQLGPIRKSSGEEYNIDLYHLRMPELQDILTNLENYFPSELLRYSSIKATQTSEGIKYTIAD